MTREDIVKTLLETKTLLRKTVWSLCFPGFVGTVATVLGEVGEIVPPFCTTRRPISPIPIMMRFSKL